MRMHPQRPWRQGTAVQAHELNGKHTSCSIVQLSCPISSCRAAHCGAVRWLRIQSVQVLTCSPPPALFLPPSFPPLTLLMQVVMRAEDRDMWRVFLEQQVGRLGGLGGVALVEARAVGQAAGAAGGGCTGHWERARNVRCLRMRPRALQIGWNGQDGWTTGGCHGRWGSGRKMDASAHLSAPCCAVIKQLSASAVTSPRHCCAVLIQLSACAATGLGRCAALPLLGPETLLCRPQSFIVSVHAPPQDWVAALRMGHALALRPCCAVLSP